MVSQLFEEKAKQVNSLATKPGNDVLLRLYGLYKQATVGDCVGDRPGVFSMKERAKWDAWDKLRGMTGEEAEKLYIELVEDLFAAEQ
ncbi:long-chain fatty acid transporter ACB1 KNAG_0D03950 [Huiozyma naganishii CBS 8797]|uniref:ACB domain-containing protein n=1 Tax=Huiozyma naganishii (strain ATCC MYA-139 / BCRC 22969 / CBS 8797 / KCTC 17520 / NBRC 10181 / NCYC 3082 / Yp74L-3) TaxID=1071383 RepID=J7S767_HUIN7|nr:hypothetical protein KNAG_0D03950 [Kazachstania naganishii CBS 8797]CCK70141.1 hypothetical protein KNAG_0D03950 [Kazachstania naganishii CBS 8797]